jgi:hypothetical protein
MLFIFFFVMDAPGQLTSVNEIVKTLTNENNSLRAQLTARKSKGLFIECHLGIMPNVLPMSGRIYILYIFQQNPIEHVGEQFGLPGATIIWPKNYNMPPAGYSCDVNNHSDSLLINVTITLYISFLRKLPNGSYQGAYRSIKGIVTISKIDIGHDNAFVFYIYNMAPDMISVRMPKTAAAQQLETQEKYAIPVATNATEMVFSPFHESLSPP